MIVSIDHSPDWKRPRPTSLDWALLLEAFFLQFPARRPASRLEVLLLSKAMQCPEVEIERHRPPLHAHDAGLHRVPDKIGNVMRAQLGHHSSPVKLHGFHRDV